MDGSTGWSLTTERLVIRREGDASSAVSSPVFGAGAWTWLAIAPRATPGPIGRLGVRVEPDEPTAEITVSLAVEVRRRGYGAEALAALVDHLLTGCGFVRVVAVTHQDDERVHRLLGRVGFDPVARDGDEVVFSRRGDQRV